MALHIYWGRVCGSPANLAFLFDFDKVLSKKNYLIKDR